MLSPRAIQEIHAIRQDWRGDFADRPLVNGMLELTADERRELDAQADAFWNKAGKTALFHRGGHVVATRYATKMLQWTAVSRIVTVGGRRIFINCCPPRSWGIRLYFFAAHLPRGIPLLRCGGHNWKRACEAKSLIPPFRWKRPRMLAMPFIDAVNGHDYFVRAGSLKHPDAAMAWVDAATDADKLAMLRQAGALLARLHRADILWGESIPMNLLIDARRRVLFADAETDYFFFDREKQKALDLETLKGSSVRTLPHVADAVRAAVDEGYSA